MIYFSTDIDIPIESQLKAFDFHQFAAIGHHNGLAILLPLQTC